MPAGIESIPPPSPAARPGSTGAAAWTDPELLNPHEHREKAAKVRSMFAAIARSYDLNNRLHSLGRDRAWRRRAVEAAAIRPGDVALDVACGTGDVTLALARTPAARVIGVDFTPEMLALARRKQRRLPAPARGRVEFIEGDAQELPLPDGSVDAVTIAFGIRNVREPARAVGEFARVLRPGGRLVVLEFGVPRSRAVRWFNAWYCQRLMPWTATLIAGDKSGAYRYLPRSVASFMGTEELHGLMRAAGFGSITARPLTLGICVCHRGVRG